MYDAIPIILIYKKKEERAVFFNRKLNTLLATLKNDDNVKSSRGIGKGDTL